MKVKGLLLVSLGLAALMALLAFHTAAQLPPGTELPTHWNGAGEVDGTMPALRALLFPAIMLVVVSLIFAAIPRLEPLQDRLEASAPVLRVAWIGMMGIMLCVEVMIAAPAYGFAPGSRLVIAGVGLLLLMVGNVLPKSRPGFFVGIRTPWTITDTDNWIATHRLGGRLAMLAGAAMILAAFLPLAPRYTTAIVLGAVLLSAVPPIVYSWWLWHRGGGRSQS